jgi:hypothetical protein
MLATNLVHGLPMAFLPDETVAAYGAKKVNSQPIRAGPQKVLFAPLFFCFEAHACDSTQAVAASCIDITHDGTKMQRTMR